MESFVDRRYIALAFWAALAFTLVEAWIPAKHAIEAFGWDKLNHGLAFVTLTVLAVFGYPQRSPIVIAVALSAVGALIELVQGLPVINRDCDFYDWVADTIAVGITLGGIAAVKWTARVLRSG